MALGHGDQKSIAIEIIKTIGTNIPIHSEDTMRTVKPDYLLVLPWHFINEFKEREKDYLGFFNVIGKDKARILYFYPVSLSQNSLLPLLAKQLLD